MEIEMVSETNAYKNLKTLIGETFDFIIVASSAVPNLKKTIKFIEDEKDGFLSYGLEYTLAKPEDFKELKFDDIGFMHVNLERLNRVLKNSEGQNLDKSKTSYNLSKFILISSFSYFENYIQSVIQEFIEFHEEYNKYFLTINTKNDAKKYSRIGFDEMNNYFNDIDETVKKLKKKISAPFVQSKIQQYEKYSLELKEKNFKFPRQILSINGIRFLIENLVERNNKYEFDISRAADIPNILKERFYLNCDKLISNYFPDKNENIENLDKANIATTFKNIREMRNKVAHGENPNLNLNQVIEYNYFLKKFATIVDKHFIEHFFYVDILDN